MGCTRFPAWCGSYQSMPTVTLVGTALRNLMGNSSRCHRKSHQRVENPDNILHDRILESKTGISVNIGDFEFNWFMLIVVLCS